MEPVTWSTFGHLSTCSRWPTHAYTHTVSCLCAGVLMSCTHAVMQRVTTHRAQQHPCLPDFLIATPECLRGSRQRAMRWCHTPVHSPILMLVCCWEGGSRSGKEEVASSTHCAFPTQAHEHQRRSFGARGQPPGRAEAGCWGTVHGANRKSGHAPGFRTHKSGRNKYLPRCHCVPRRLGTYLALQSSLHKQCEGLLIPRR